VNAEEGERKGFQTNGGKKEVADGTKKHKKKTRQAQTGVTRSRGKIRKKNWWKVLKGEQPK